MCCILNNVKHDLWWMVTGPLKMIGNKKVEKSVKRFVNFVYIE